MIVILIAIPLVTVSTAALIAAVGIISALPAFFGAIVLDVSLVRLYRWLGRTETATDVREP